MINKCEHSVYIPPGEQVARYCQGCNPETNDKPSITEVAPQFNRRGALAMTTTGKLPKCPQCGGILPSSTDRCAICGSEYDVVAPEKLRANQNQRGICPTCGSGIHYEIDSKLWKCAECYTEYRADKPKRKRR